MKNKIFLLLSWGEHVCRVQPSKQKICFYNNKTRASTSQLVSNITVLLLCLEPSELQELSLSCLWCLFISRQTSLSHQRVWSQTRTWQQSAAPPGGSKDVHSHSHCRNPPSWSLTLSTAGQRRTRTVCNTQPVFPAGWERRTHFVEPEQQWDFQNGYICILQKGETVFLSSPSLAHCYHSFHGASGSFKRNMTGTKWFHCFSPINREQLQTKR